MNAIKDSYREEIDILLAEYQTLREEILMRIDFQYKLLSYALALLGAMVTLFITLLGLSWKPPITNETLLLISALPFFFFSWSFSNEDIYIARLGRYINTTLRHRMQNLLGGKTILEWEKFLAEIRRPCKLGWKRILWLLSKGVRTLGAEVMLVIPLLFILLYIYLLRNTCEKISRIEICLLSVDAIMLVISAFMRVSVYKEYSKINPP